MVSTLYQSKIDTLQSQIAELQVKVERLSQAKVSSEQAVVVVRTALLQVTEADPDEVASLKAELLALFDSNGNQGSEQPVSPTSESDPLWRWQNFSNERYIVDWSLTSNSDKPSKVVTVTDLSK